MRTFIHKKIMERRKQQRLSQTELAQRAGTTQKYISKIENGLHMPSAQHVSNIAFVLGVKESFFFE